jgi:hypothetical protein
MPGGSGPAIGTLGYAARSRGVAKVAKPVRNLIVISDTHCGCRLALCPPGKIPLDDGGSYEWSNFQRKMWALWREFWDAWVPEVTRGEAYDVVHNGDAIDGVHHNSTTQISQNIEDQLVIAERVLAPVAHACRKSGGTYYHIRGTQAHVGQSGIYEEQLAKRLEAKPNKEGQHARYDLWKRVGVSTKRVRAPLVHLLHHIGTTSSASHESSAVNAELTAMYVEAARWGKEPPDFIVRSHRHRSIAVDLNSAKGYAAAIVTPAWQGKTPFVWKVPGARTSEPQIGGIAIRTGDEEFYYRRKVWTFDRSDEE